MILGVPLLELVDVEYTHEEIELFTRYGEKDGRTEWREYTWIKFKNGRRIIVKTIINRFDIREGRFDSVSLFLNKDGLRDDEITKKWVHVQGRVNISTAIGLKLKEVKPTKLVDNPNLAWAFGTTFQLNINDLKVKVKRFLNDEFGYTGDIYLIPKGL